MKISTRLRLGVYAPILMAVAIILALAYSYQETARIQQSGDTVRQIRSSITDLNHFGVSYVLYHDESEKQQFLAGIDSLSRLLAQAQVQSQAQLALLDHVRADSAQMGDLFRQLIAGYEAAGAAGTPESQAAHDRLVSLFLETSFEADTNAASLRSLIDAGIQTSEERTSVLVLAVIALTTIPLTILLVRTRRGIISSLARLSAGAAGVGSGNLDSQIPVQGSDEIADLSRAFNRMTASLKTVTASKSELEKQVEVRRKAEQALQESEQRWATTLASIGDAVIASDAAGDVTFLNAEAVRLTGWTLAEARGRPVAAVFNIINERTRKTVASPIPRILSEGVVVGLANHTLLVKKDGTETPIDDSGAPIMDENRNIRGVVLVFRDVTERRRADKLKDDFIGLVSHELRTPLTVIMGSVATARTPGLAPGQVGTLMDKALAGAESLRCILDNLLELSRYQAQRLSLSTETLDIAELAAETVARVKDRHPDYDYMVTMGASPPALVADRIRVERIIYNLVENAAKYSPAGSRIEVTGARVDGEMRISVSDRGIGLAPDERERLFQPFQRLVDQHEFTKGLGLGLVVCKHLVEAHHGRIWVESEKGKGSTFAFSLPLAPVEK
jgi:PAS domain S-box-containing protein